MLDVSQVPKITTRFTTGIHGTRHRFVSMALVYYSERLESKVPTGQGVWGKVGRKPGTSFPASSPGGVAQDMLNSSCSDSG